MKKILLLLFIFSATSFAQKTKTVSRKIDLDKSMFDFDTQQIIKSNEAKEKLMGGKYFPLPKSYNERAEVIDYYLVEQVKKGERLNTSKFHPKPEIGKIFPPFIAEDINGKTIDSKNLNGKILILGFYISSDERMLSENTIKELSVLATSNNNFYPVVFLTNKIDHNRSILKDYKVSFPVIEDAFDFGHKYGIDIYPQYIVVNSNGETQAIIKGLDELKDFLKNM